MERIEAEKELTLAERIKNLEVEMVDVDSGFEKSKDSNERYDFLSEKIIPHVLFCSFTFTVATILATTRTDS